MIRNYFLIAIRSLWRNKLVTLINLAGMAIGFGIFLTFWSWVRFDLSFDRFHEDIDQMYVLNVKLEMEESEYTSERTGGIFASVLKDNFPQVLSSCRISEALEFELGVRNEDKDESTPMKYFNENEVLAVDSVFLNFFSFRLLEGDPNQAFSERDHILITRELAEKLFGDDSSLGQEIKLGEGDFYKVAGVLEDPPAESSFQFKALLGFHVLEQRGYPVDGYGGTMYYNNFKLARETDLKALNAAINDFVSENSDADLVAQYFMGPLTRMHLHGESRSILGLFINMIMSLVILSIACVNFINLTTAYSSERTKEIAIRKSLGAGKRQLVFQFMGETYLLLLVAFYLGLFIAEHLVPATSRVFNQTFQTEFTGIVFWGQMVILFLLTGLLAGLYPAIKIAGLKAPSFLTGKNGGKIVEKGRSRKVLIVVQFTFSIIFIIVSIFMIRQYTHLKEADLGFNREDVMYIRTTGKIWENYPQVKRELSEMHFVEGVTTASSVPVMISSGEINWGERDGDRNKIAVILRTDEDFLSTFEIDLREGRYFYEGHDSLNHGYVVVNQALIDLMGWEDPVGRSFYLWDQDFRILGVTENINFFPFNLEIFNDQALIYWYQPVRQFVFIRTREGITPEEISMIEEVFRTHNPGYEFSYEFVSDFEYEALESGDGIGFMFRLFSVVAVFIAAMGLLGLSLYNNSKRTKEVGIRKAMGAHSGIILKLLLSDFMRLVTLSNLIGMTASYFIVRRLLQIFSYRVEIKPSVFLLVFFLSLLFSLATVAFLAFRTARSNPVDSLRYE